ncbi:bifunctional protein-disulfide isomerase/oxidoreductase DsbC [Vibrio ziniensis]|uniref:Thiol:disulfide interchange protein n=1 Tax=Vibrio ziniensis TaxID=2711221 RepID=A0A6G7CFP9_9VIBR|nr:bifunctional protein-disulfide isomerase/oxidoreductase DsbC [Vibrio ziniensis]QIH40900.1 bifunctional protein-disulfide isomerase/oxidoreductase DsbC [Vibrio ziniensis]
MSVFRRLTLLLVPFLALASFSASSSAATDIDKDVFINKFEKLGMPVIDVVPSSIDGLVEVKTEGGVLFASPDAQYLIAGTLYELSEDGSYVDVMAKRQAPINAEKIAQFRDSMIEYKAENEKYAVTVFTDITCGYCVRLHQEMKEYNKRGITVRYLAFPRQGASGQVADSMAQIWCSEDPAAAMHNAKVTRTMAEVAKGKNLAQCKQTITDHYQLGRQLGISGTPAIFLPSGDMVGGYLPPAQLEQRLQQQ